MFVVKYLNTCASFRVANVLSRVLTHKLLMLQTTNSDNMKIKMGMSHPKNPSLSRAPNTLRASAQHARAHEGKRCEIL